jgi:hypothetical protein
MFICAINAEFCFHIQRLAVRVSWVWVLFRSWNFTVPLLHSHISWKLEPLDVWKYWSLLCPTITCGHVAIFFLTRQSQIACNSVCLFLFSLSLHCSCFHFSIAFSPAHFPFLASLLLSNYVQGTAILKPVLLKSLECFCLSNNPALPHVRIPPSQLHPRCHEVAKVGKLPYMKWSWKNTGWTLDHATA